MVRLIFNIGLMLAIAGAIALGYYNRLGTPAANMEQITVAELKTLLDNNADVVTVDVRKKRIYDHGHIPGAISMPYPDEIKSRHKELPADKILIIY